MKAAQIRKYGGKEVVEITDTPRPGISSGQVLVRVKASGVNPADWKVREGHWQTSVRFPITLGGDFSGIVEAADAAFRKGDEVFGYASALSGSSGAFAQYVAVSENKIARKPKNISFEQAAALPLAGIGALDVLTKMKLSKGQKILIHGGAGGIGSFAIQIAKHIGAYVATTVSAEDMEYARGLGADEVIDYKNQAFEEIIKEYDAVLDPVGGKTLERSYPVLKKGGMIVTMVGTPDKVLMDRYGVRAQVENASAAISRESLTQLAGLVGSRAVRVHIDRTFPLEEAGEAISYQQTGHPNGKVIIEA